MYVFIVNYIIHFNKIGFYKFHYKVILTYYFNFIITINLLIDQNKVNVY